MLRLLNLFPIYVLDNVILFNFKLSKLFFFLFHRDLQQSEQTRNQHGTNVDDGSVAIPKPSHVLSKERKATNKKSLKKETKLKSGKEGNLNDTQGVSVGDMDFKKRWRKLLDRTSGRSSDKEKAEKAEKAEKKASGWRSRVYQVWIF